VIASARKTDATVFEETKIDASEDATPASWEDLQIDGVRCAHSELYDSNARHEPSTATVDIQSNEDPAQNKGSNHSRFRKDLVNLNKAVAKWLQQERSGLLRRQEIKARIKASKVAEQLRCVHGENFSVDAFVAEAIDRGLRVGA